MFAKIVVDYYGAPTPVNQLASFHVPEPRMAVITPYDKRSLGAIEKAIRDSDLGVNPTNDGNIIRVVFPQLTEERRKDLIKVARHKAEDGRVSIRNIRRHAKDALDKLVKDGEVGEDDVAPRREGAREAHPHLRRPGRRGAAAQGSRAARGLRRARTTHDARRRPSRRPAAPAATCRSRSASASSLGALVLLTLYLFKPAFLVRRRARDPRRPVGDRHRAPRRRI